MPLAHYPDPSQAIILGQVLSSYEDVNAGQNNEPKVVGTETSEC
jgi:hypothetical protein